MTIRKEFRQSIKEFFNPESGEMNLLFLKLKYTNAMRQDVAQAVALLKSRQVLFAKIDQELWDSVFHSLLGLRNALSELSGRLTTKGPNDVKAAVSFMIDIINSYLIEYRKDFTLFMQDPQQQHLPPAHRERNWKRLRNAAQDLIMLRRLLHAEIQNINKYAESGSMLDRKEPSLSNLKYWVDYAQARSFCPNCQYNMLYAYDDECPKCPSDKTVFKLSGRGTSTAALAGSFNNWNPIEMQRSAYLEWIVRIKLRSGKHTYKFNVDGDWIIDPANPKIEFDDSRNQNSIVEVK